MTQLFQFLVEAAKTFRNITIKLLRINGTNTEEWWTVHEECDDYNFQEFLSKAPFQDCEHSLIIYTFNDKVFPPTLNWITGGG